MSVSVDEKVNSLSMGVISDVSIHAIEKDYLNVVELNWIQGIIEVMVINFHGEILSDLSSIKVVFIEGNYV